MDERIAERRREVREVQRRRRLRRTVFVVSAVVLLGVAALIERSSLVALDEVEVTGTVRLSPDTVRAAAALPLGTSTLRLDLGAAEERVTALPLVLTADARRVDPLTVLIEVEERQPAYVARDGGDAVIVDRDGVAIAAGSEEPLPVVEVGRLPEVGATVAAVPALANAHAAFIELSGPLRTDVVRYVATDRDDVDLILRNGTRVRFGRADRVDEKVRALGAVLEDIGDTAVSVIDVRAPLTPVVRR